jgi:hypothetical protein
MYGWDSNQDVTMVKSSYQLKSGGDGYDGIDDWEYVHEMGDLDQCNGMFGPTPEYPDGIYHYVSTPLSGSTNTHVDTDGTTVPMVGFPYFQICYYGQATGGPKGGGGGGPGPGPGGAMLQAFPDILLDEEGKSLLNGENIGAMLIQSAWLWIALIALAYAGYRRRK